jgi:CBS domain-containing protein
MHVSDLMSHSPECCTPRTSLRQAARMMCDADCGAIPVVDESDNRTPIGIITDRDIACRAVSKGLGPDDTEVMECMTSTLATIATDASIEECCRIMENRQVRRLVVIDRMGRVAGIVSQADIALHLGPDDTAEVVREISYPQG